MESVLSPIQQYVVDFVIKLRKEKGLTQSNVGVIINATVGFIGNVENPKNRAKYNLDHINALADYFNIAPGDFLPKKAFPLYGLPKKRKHEDG